MGARKRFTGNNL